ncbi:MAG: virulence factor SrfB, partial [Bacteroidetes bacterium]|nr:virulence factor SrfB [Bacteroidota bacterium]
STVYFTPKKHDFTIQFDGPMLIGLRQMPDEEWTSAPLYKLTFSTYEAAERLGSRLPLMIDLERDPENKEEIKNIRNIIDKNDKRVANSDLKFVLQTLSDEYGYWMDTGSYNLPIF